MSDTLPVTFADPTPNLESMLREAQRVKLAPYTWCSSLDRDAYLEKMRLLFAAALLPTNP